jgi:hypothetical protein
MEEQTLPTKSYVYLDRDPEKASTKNRTSPNKRERRFQSGSLLLFALTYKNRAANVLISAECS